MCMHELVAHCVAAKRVVRAALAAGSWKAVDADAC